MTECHSDRLSRWNGFNSRPVIQYLAETRRARQEQGREKKMTAYWDHGYGATIVCEIA